jgi:hypothetical protein
MAGKSKPLTVITDRQPEKWEQFILDCLTNTQAQVDDEESGGLRGMYFAAIMNDSRVLSGYETLVPMDIMSVAGSAILDAVDLYIEENIDHYHALAMGEEDDCDDGGELEC